MPLETIVRSFVISGEVMATHSGPDVTCRQWPTALLPLVG